ncbi:MAG: fibrobacter succinogenes major paralogous domain-containing protein [Bacteroidetes bacterium]|nr:fibrobacter succinogenes major paralogous domain-containing protein [Bacteroidota bacterium]
MKRNFILLLILFPIILKAQLIGTFTDYSDGNTYKTVKIGNQTWMAENLKTTHYKNGNAIPKVTDNTVWAALATGAYCDYNNTPASSATYGLLYNWFTVNTGNLCPIGWHVPSDAEWKILITYLGDESIVGGKLKEAGLAHWVTPNTDATNETGFTALPCGYRASNGTYYDIGTNGYWWSSTESSTGGVWNMHLTYDSGNEDRYSGIMVGGRSVRCIKD